MNQLLFIATLVTTTRGATAVCAGNLAAMADARVAAWNALPPTPAGTNAEPLALPYLINGDCP
ncbi:hypothetical protein [Thiobacter aerophilum]|uniref:Uncharacterized protein n=1 Tax=Thiobacter aerophilum TaxID=3121275 RepID=A0ABV0EEV7_9BURK